MNIVALALLQAAVPAAPAPAPAGAMIEQAANPEELLLFAVQLETFALTDGLTAFGEPTDPYLPIGELSRLLDLNIEVDAAAARVTGALGRDRRPVLLDLRSGVGRNGGAALAVAPGDFKRSGSDIYVRVAALEALLPIRVTIDAEGLAIRVTPTELLPVQERRARLARAAAGSADNEPEEVMQVESPYRLFSAPGFDLVLGSGYDTREGSTRQYDLRAAGDLLYGSVQAYVGSDRDGRPYVARFLYERRSATGDMPLGLRRFSAGDVFTSGLALGPRGVSGRGISLSTVPLESVSVFDTIDLRGELPNGHDVELYVNDVLRGSQSAPRDGRYEFLAIPLSCGLNRLRIVIHGPTGERTEQERVINVGGGQLRAGETWLEAGLIEQERALIEPGGGIDSSLRLNVGAPRLVASIAHGLSTSLTLVGGIAAYSPSGEGPRHVANAGVRTSIGGFAVQADAAGDSQSGAAVSMGAAGRVGGVSTVIRHAEYRGGFADENVALADPQRPMSRRTSVAADTSLPIFGRATPLSLRLLRTGYADGGSSWLIGARTSTSLAGALLSANMDYQRETSGGAAHGQLSGSLSASAIVGGSWQVRGLLDYEIVPDAELRTIAFSADRSVSEGLALRFGVGHSLSGRSETSMEAGPILRLPFGDLALTGLYTPQRGHLQLGVRFSIGSLFDPSRGRYVLTRPGPSSGGAVAFEAFVDRNGDGRFGEGDDPVSGIAVSGGERRIVTDASGRAMATGFGSAPRARLEVDMTGMLDLSLAGPPDAIAFTPRPGQVVRVRYPLAPVGEVYLRFAVRQADEAVGISALRVRLVAADGRHFEATTQYDGSAVVGDLPLGRYTLELDPEQATRLRVSLAAAVGFELRANEAPTVEAELKFEAGEAAPDA